MPGLPTVMLLVLAAPQDVRIADPLREYTVDVPAGWRQLTPDEARDLRPKLPPDLRELPIPGTLDRYGPVDQWIAKGFDGRCLTVDRSEGEPAMTEATLQQIRELARQRSASAQSDYEMVIQDLELGAVGPRRHPAIERTVLLRDKDGPAIAGLLEFLVPTGGSSLHFSYRADAKDFPLAEALFRKSAATLEIRRPPQGRKELSDKLRMPLIIGGVVGLVLLVLYKMRPR